MAEQNFSAKVAIERIYVRKLNFEPQDVPSIFDLKWRPNVKLDIQAKHRELGDQRFEVSLDCKLNAEIGGKLALSLELEQSGVFRVEGVEGPPLHHVLGVICPNILFPYARETLDSITVKGGLPPFAIAPVNFDAMLKKVMDQQKSTSAEFTDQVLN